MGLDGGFHGLSVRNVTSGRHHGRYHQNEINDIVQWRRLKFLLGRGASGRGLNTYLKLHKLFSQQYAQNVNFSINLSYFRILGA